MYEATFLGATSMFGVDFQDIKMPPDRRAPVMWGGSLPAAFYSPFAPNGPGPSSPITMAGSYFPWDGDEGVSRSSSVICACNPHQQALH